MLELRHLIATCVSYSQWAKTELGLVIFKLKLVVCCDIKCGLIVSVEHDRNRTLYSPSGSEGL